jgi:hypothetical protein
VVASTDSVPEVLIWVEKADFSSAKTNLNPSTFRQANLIGLKGSARRHPFDYLPPRLIIKRDRVGFM